MFEERNFEIQKGLPNKPLPSHQNQRRVELEIKNGRVAIHSFCNMEDISSLSFNEMMIKCHQYRPIITKNESLMEVASKQDANVTLAFSTERQIVGLGLLQYASPEDRWSRVGDSVMMEISALEVSPPWRNAGLGKEILNLLLDHPLKEDRIFFMVGYSWSWDLKETGMRASDYHKKMVKLFTKHGFRNFKTNEPNIMLRPENLFMARIGKNVSESIQKRFCQVRFDIDRYFE